MNNKGLEKYWGDYEHEFHIFEKDIMEKVISAISHLEAPYPKILDIGVGNGRFIKVLKNYGIYGDFYGVDIIKHHALTHYTFIRADSRYLPFKNDSFDFVYSLGVVEHFPETEHAIKEHARVTKRRGMILITTPHFGFDYPFAMLHYFLSGRYKLGSFQETTGRFLTIHYLVSCFSNSDLEIVDYGAFREVIPSLANKLPNIYKIFCKVFPECKFGRHLFIIAKKNDKK